MRISWPQHLQAARVIEAAAVDQQGMAFALLGVSLLLLAEDLLAAQLADSPAAAGGSEIRTESSRL